MYAATTLSFFQNIPLFEEVRNSSEPTTHIIEKKDSSEVTWFLAARIISEALGFFAGCVISAVLVLKRRFHWMNAILIILIAYCLFCFGIIRWKEIAVLFRWIYFIPNLTASILLKAGIALFVSLAIFFSKRIRNFIRKNETLSVHTVKQ
jgi:hypothetical protein